MVVADPNTSLLLLAFGVLLMDIPFSFSLGRTMKILAALLIAMLLGCSSKTKLDRHPLVVYRPYGESSPQIEVSIQLHSLSDRMPEEKLLNSLAHEVLDKYPLGIGPDRVAGSYVERINVKQGNKTSRLEVYSDEETNNRETRQAEKELFKKLRDELLRIVANEANSRSRSYEDLK